jgi:pyridoxine 4-dehydrogenase
MARCNWPARMYSESLDPEEARAVLREALELGVDHIDTSDYYGPHVTNRLIREALFPIQAI